MARFFAFILALQLVSAAAFAAKPVVDIGHTPPDYLGRDNAGAEVLLSTDPGKVTVITFWATWCGQCLRELPILEGIQRQVGREHIRVIAVNLKEDKAVFRRVNKKLFDYKLTFAHDKNGEVAKLFGVNGLPSMFILNKRGEVADIHLGYADSMVQGLADELNTLLAER